MEHLCLLLGFRFRGSECDLRVEIEDLMLAFMKGVKICQSNLFAIIFWILFLVSAFGEAAELVDHSYFIDDPDLYNDYFPPDYGNGDVVILAFYSHSAPRSFVLDESGGVVHISYRDADLLDGAESFADRKMNSKSVLPWNLLAYQNLKKVLEEYVADVTYINKEKIVADGSVIQFYLRRGNGGGGSGASSENGVRSRACIGCVFSNIGGDRATGAFEEK